MKNTTARITMMKITAGLILFPDEEADCFWQLELSGNEGEEEEGEQGEKIGGLVIAPLLWWI